MMINFEAQVAWTGRGGPGGLDGPRRPSSFPRYPAGKWPALYRTMFGAQEWGMSTAGRRQEGRQGDGK